MNLEAPIKVCQFRRQYNVSTFRMCAILGAMFPEQRRVSYVVPSDVLKFMRANVLKSTRELHEMAREKRQERELETA